MSLTGGITLAPLKVEIKADIAGFKSDMEKAKAAGVSEANKISKELEKTAKVGENLSTVGVALTRGVTLPLAAVSIAAGKMSMDFGKSMGMVTTLLNGTTEEAKIRTKELSKSVLQVSDDTGVAASNISDGLYQVISAYGDTADSAEILEIAAKGAKASGATTADTINLLSAVTKGYGDTSASANQKAADLAFMTAKLGQTTFPELAGSIGQVVPLCENLKISQEELFGVMATATGVTGNASEVTTQFKGILQSLMSPTKSMTNLMGELGYTNGQAMIESLGFQGALNKIVKAAEDSGVPLQDYIGSIEGQVLALALAGAQSENLTEKTLAMSKATGAANEAFEKSQDNVGAKFENALNKAMNALIRLGDAAAPMLEKVAELISEAADWFSQLTEEQQENILKWGALAMAAGPVLNILGEGIQIFTKLKPLVSGLSKGLEALSTASKVTSTTIPKATTVAADLAKEVSGLPSILKPAAKGVGDLAEAGGAVTKALPGTAKTVEGVTYAIDGVTKVAAPASTALTNVAGAAGTTEAAAVGASTALGSSGLSGVLANVLGPTLGTAVMGIGVLGITAASVGFGIYDVVKQVNASVIPEVDIFTSKLDEANQRVTANSGQVGIAFKKMDVDISDATKAAVNSYMTLDAEAYKSMMSLYLNSTVITQDIANDMMGKYAVMGQTVKTSLESDYSTRITLLEGFFNQESSLSEEQQVNVMTRLTTNFEEQKAVNANYIAQISAIYQAASDQNRGITAAEQAEISRIQGEMKVNAIRTLSETEAESAVILGRIKEQDGRITAEMASEHVAKLEEQRQKSIDAANLEYAEKVSVFSQMRDELGIITDEEAASMIADAERQRDGTIDAANATKDQGLVVLGNAYSGLRDDVNVNTGEILSHWDRVQNWWNSWWPGAKEADVNTNAESSVASFQTAQLTWDGLVFETKYAVVQYSEQGGFTGGGMGGGGGKGFATGLPYVPYDNFSALLHKGERVLTEQENKAYMQDNNTDINESGGFIIKENNFYIREESDIEKVAIELYKLKRKKERGG